MYPGCTELTRMPSGPYFTARALVSIRTPPLDAWYAGWPPSSPTNPMTRRDVDDGAAARSLHRGNGMLASEEDPRRVDVHDAVPSLGVERVGHRGAAHSGVVDEDVELAVAGNGGLHG